MLLLGARDDPIGRRIPGLRRLVQSHAVAHPSGFPPADFDGVAELWFDDLAAIEAAPRSAEWRASTEDEAHFGTRLGQGEDDGVGHHPRHPYSANSAWKP